MDGMKLAGPAAGGYDGGQKMSTQKRKRDKAQEQLRTRMRQRINGARSSSTLLHPRRHTSLHDVNGDTTTLSPNVNNLSTEMTQNNQANNYWRSQHDRYTALSQIQSGRTPRINKNQTVPLQELVDRVLHRKEQNFGLGSKGSPMTIRAYKPPVAPYAIQQQSVIKKMVVMQPIPRRKPEEKGPFVLVLQRNGRGDNKNEKRGRRRNTSDVTAESDGGKSQGTDSVSGNIMELPPVNAGKTAAQSEVELKTWRPALEKVHQQSVLPEAEDRSVTNYRLQLQHANKLAEARFEFQHPVPSIRTVEEITAQSLNSLPPIQTMFEDESMESIKSDNVTPSRANSKTSATIDAKPDAMTSGEQQSKNTWTKSGDIGADRTTSKTDILNMKKACREAKHQQKSSDELTLLRTRRRFTTKTKQFKNDFQRARQLSAIEEDRSSLGSDHLSRLSAERTSVSSSSMSSLSKIDESKHGNGSVNFGIRDAVECNRSDSEKVEGKSSSGSIQNTSHVHLAPPTTTTIDEDPSESDVVLGDDTVNKITVDLDSSDEDSIMDEGEPINGDNPSSGKDAIKETPEPVITHGEDIMDGMTWVEGDIPFRENGPTHQEPTVEHGR